MHAMYSKSLSFLGFQNLAVQEPDPCISKHVAAHVPFHGENPKASNNLNCTAKVLGSSKGGWQQAMTCDLTFIHFYGISIGLIMEGCTVSNLRTL